MQQVSLNQVNFSPFAFSNNSTFEAGLTRIAIPFPTHVPEEKLEPLRMEHFFLGTTLGKTLIVFWAKCKSEQ